MHLQAKLQKTAEITYFQEKKQQTEVRAFKVKKKVQFMF